MGGWNPAVLGKVIYREISRKIGKIPIYQRNITDNYKKNSEISVDRQSKGYIVYEISADISDIFNTESNTLKYYYLWIVHYLQFKVY